MCNLFTLVFINILYVQFILWGDKAVSTDDEYVKITKAVHTFIQEYGRFD